VSRVYLIVTSFSAEKDYKFGDPIAHDDMFSISFDAEDMPGSQLLHSTSSRPASMTIIKEKEPREDVPIKLIAGETKLIDLRDCQTQVSPEVSQYHYMRMYSQRNALARFKTHPHFTC
jgi:hypothetical protein